jgi:hypothetical protein
MSTCRRWILHGTDHRTDRCCRHDNDNDNESENEKLTAAARAIRNLRAL